MSCLFFGCLGVMLLWMPMSAFWGDAHAGCFPSGSLPTPSGLVFCDTMWDSSCSAVCRTSVKSRDDAGMVRQVPQRKMCRSWCTISLFLLQGTFPFEEMLSEGSLEFLNWSDWALLDKHVGGGHWRPLAWGSLVVLFTALSDVRSFWKSLLEVGLVAQDDTACVTGKVCTQISPPEGFAALK